MSRTFSIAVAITALTLSGNAIGASFSLGAIGTRTSSIYKDVSPKNGGFPFISIVGEHAFLKGNQLGYALLPNNSPQNLMFGVEYNQEHFDPSDSDNAAMQRLDKRKATGMINVRAKYNVFFGKLAYDIGDRHNGYYALAGVGYPIHLSAWTLTPSLSFQYFDKKMSTYLYGVSQSESLRTGFGEYKSGSTRKVTVALHASYTVTPSLNVLLGVEHADYKDVLDSPIIERDYSYSASAGIVYTF